ARVRAPVEEPRLASEIIDQPDALEDDPLLEETASKSRVETRCQAVIQRVGDSRVEQIEAGMADEPRAEALPPRLEAEADESVFQNLEVLLHRPRREHRVSADRARVQDVSTLRRRHVEEPAEPPEVPDERLGLDLFSQICLAVGLEEVARL